MREIGSEFWDVPIKKENNKLFPRSVQWFLSGRSALQAIIKNLRGCHTVAIPSWCCDSMIKPFIENGFEICFYPVYWNDNIIQEIRFDSDVLLLMDYFGYTGKQVDLGDYKGIVIRDVTHSILSRVYSDADYYFGSLRKWCGIWTGGYAWTKDNHCLNYLESMEDGRYIILRKNAMRLKSSYINGCGITDKKYLELFDEAEGLLEKIGIVSAVNRDITMALSMDVEFIKTRRRENAAILQSAFPDMIMFSEMGKSDCPMFVPILVPDRKRDELRHYLIKKEIYCPIHWPFSEYHRRDKETEIIYENEISLVCDQRYTERDMLRMIDVIRTFMEEM